MKRALIVITGILALGFIGYRYLEAGGKGTISPRISERSREYLQGRKDSNDTQWRRIEVDDTKDGTSQTGTTVRVDECFSIQVPFPMTEARRESECSYRIFLADPKGYIVVYRHDATAASLDDIPDVQMRRIYTDQYTETTETVGPAEFVTFRRSGTEYEKTAFLLRNGGIYVLSFIIPTNENLDGQFTRMLSSLRFIMK